MTDSIATLSQQNDISIIKLDDGKANAFSYEMLSQVNELLKKVPRDSGALVITGRDGLFSGGFDLRLRTALLSQGHLPRSQIFIRVEHNSCGLF